LKLAHFASLVVATSLDHAAAQSACPACNACNVQPIVKTGSVGPLPPGSNYPPVPVERFDSSLGTLTGVQYSVWIQTSNRRVGLENNDPNVGCPATSNYPAYWQWIEAVATDPADSSVIAQVHAADTYVEGGFPAVTHFDGCVDFGVCHEEPTGTHECCPGCPVPMGSGPDGGSCAPGETMPQGSGYHHVFADQQFTFATSCVTHGISIFEGLPGTFVNIPIQAASLQALSGPGGNISMFWTSLLSVRVAITYTYCPSGAVGSCPICFGDNTASLACPCSNPGIAGHGCNNSMSTGGAILHASGTTNPDTVVLTSSNQLASTLSVFVQGESLLDQPAPFGDGLRCVGAPTVRLYVMNASNGSVSAPSAGDESITDRSASLGAPIAPGSTRVYQVAYRDPNFTFCPEPQGGTWNVSSGVSIVW
jgi:hypothetical protein